MFYLSVKPFLESEFVVQDTTSTGRPSSCRRLERRAKRSLELMSVLDGVDHPGDPDWQGDIFNKKKPDH